MKAVHVSGRRKRALARATLTLGNGVVRINSAKIDIIRPAMYRDKMMEPMVLAGNSAKKVDIKVTVSGGGPASQAEASRLAIARALAVYEGGLRQTFLDYDRTLLVADVRQKETHKPRCHGKARSKRQKSYR